MGMDFNIKLSNGQVLRGMIQSPGENTKAVIILVHGHGEHVQRYLNWAALFKQEGIAFLGVDLPGHGRSDGTRGDIKSYNLLGEMIDILIKSCNQTFPGCPVYIYGHSLGGGIVLDYLLRRNPKVKGAIVTSPYLRLAFEPSRIKLFIASVMKYILPGLIQPTGLNADHLSHDKIVVEKYKTDPLVHGEISVRLFSESVNAANYSLTHASELKVPTLILHGSDDLILSVEGSREFAGKTDMVELKIWDGGYHELHNEPFKDEVFKYILNWINRQQA
jgi:alpha-beta hydrolase superfamily lysophospholipase